MTDGWTHRVLANAFREFYTCLSTLGGEIEADPWQFTKQAGDEVADRSAARAKAVARARNRLHTFLRQQAIDLGRRLGPEGADRLDEAQYVMAALADEVLVNLEWEGREAWSHELLETHMFGSHVSGEQVFQRAEDLLQDAEDSDWDLAFIYLSAISLGFLGKYRGTSDDGSLQRLRRRLLTFVTRARTTLADDIDPLFPEAVEHTLVSTENLRLPPVRRWATILAILLAVYLVAQHFVWIDVSSGLREVSEQVARTTASVRGPTP